MKISSILIENFRGIQRAHAPQLGDMVIIAGQNGSGKSCVFDAIRLLKSVYGGYQQNEWQNWLGEFSIPANASSESLRGMFNDPSTQLKIECTFSFDDEEKSYINTNAETLLQDATWRKILPEAFQFGGYRLAMFASQFRERQDEVNEIVAKESLLLRAELSSEMILASVVVPVGGNLTLRPSPLLSVIFSTFKPQKIGVIDYHGAQRHYGRELVQSINISLDQTSQNQRQHALYNYANKYANVKSELAASYVKEVFSQRAGAVSSHESLTATMSDLFSTFFPDKSFNGPTPTADGNLEFPVTTGNGSKHDLDDLSAGEKEILYGYLRIRNSAPRYSIILLDEPELHLNPRLIRLLPEFYRKHLGVALKNQIWLVSHSDALLRESVKDPGFNIFHMQPCSNMVRGSIVSGASINQLKPLNLTQDVDAALTDLVGDLATYEPGRKAVIFEGGGDSDFDQKMTLALFPEIAKHANLLSGSNKNKVRALHEVLNRAYERHELKTKFFSIVDKDFDTPMADSKSVTTFAWNVYHIENYLLDENAISYVASSLGTAHVSPEKVLEDLRGAARAAVPYMVRTQLLSFVDRQLLTAIDLKSNPAAEDFSAEILTAVDRSLLRLNSLRESLLSDENVTAEKKRITDEIEGSFADGSWKQKIPGRRVLGAYSNTLPSGISGDTLRGMILSRMADTGERPEGMSIVVEQIIAG